MPTTQQPGPAELVRTLPIIVGALMMGLVVFGVVLVVLTLGAGAGPAAPAGVPGGGQASGSFGVLYVVLGVLAATGIGGYFVMGGVARTQVRRAWESRENDEAGKAAIVNTLVMTTIVRAALVESFGIFGGTLVLLTGSLLPLVAMGLSVLMVATLLPVRSRLRTLEEAATGMRMGDMGYG